MRIALITTDETRYVQALFDELSIVITNNACSPVVELCKREGITCRVLSEDLYTSREEHDLAIMKVLDTVGVDKIVLGSYQRIIKSNQFIEKYKNKMLNIHLSYLPDFKGYKAWEKAFLAGVEESGYSIHLVDKEVDNGKILFQERVSIKECKSSQEVYDILVEKSCEKIISVVNK